MVDRHLCTIVTIHSIRCLIACTSNEVVKAEIGVLVGEIGEKEINVVLKLTVWSFISVDNELISNCFFFMTHLMMREILMG